MKLLGLLHEYCHRVEVERDQLKVERDLLKQQSDALIKLKEIHATASDASLTLEVPFDIQIEVARSFCSLLENCPNYREVQFTLPVSKENPYEHITLHAIKHNGKTPHQLRLEAEAERDKAKEDTAMLDWLERKSPLALWRGTFSDSAYNVSLGSAGAPITTLSTMDEDGAETYKEIGAGDSLRAAIRNAMKESA